VNLVRASRRAAAARQVTAPIVLDDVPMLLDGETLVVEDAAVVSVDTDPEGSDDDGCIVLSARDVTLDVG
jgi:hypothetical protein